MDIVAKSYQLPSVRLHALTCGDPHGRPVVLLHGFPEYSASWEAILPALADAGFYAVAPDLRGYGQSEKPDVGYDVDTLARDVVALIDALGTGRADLVGHDWGGAIAYHVAAHFPDRIRRLSVVNCPHPRAMMAGLRRPKQLLRSWYILFFQLPLLPELVLTRAGGRVTAAFIRRSAVHGERFTPERMAGYARNFSDWQTARCALAYYRQAARRFRSTRDQVERYPKIQAPFCLIWGEQDVALTKELSYDYERYFELPPDVHYLPDVGHFGPIEAPERIAPLLIEHLRA
jgi:pimeloyl-ACP methyl ester carboxylesterase